MLVAGRLELDDPEDPFHPKPFHEEDIRKLGGEGMMEMLICPR